MSLLQKKSKILLFLLLSYYVYNVSGGHQLVAGTSSHRVGRSGTGDGREKKDTVTVSRIRWVPNSDVLWRWPSVLSFIFIFIYYNYNYKFIYLIQYTNEQNAK